MYSICKHVGAPSTHYVVLVVYRHQQFNYSVLPAFIATPRTLRPCNVAPSTANSDDVYYRMTLRPTKNDTYLSGVTISISFIWGFDRKIIRLNYFIIFVAKKYLLIFLFFNVCEVSKLINSYLKILAHYVFMLRQVF